MKTTAIEYGLIAALIACAGMTVLGASAPAIKATKAAAIEAERDRAAGNDVNFLLQHPRDCIVVSRMTHGGLSFRHCTTQEAAR